jgi:hypothetical protein
MKKKQFDTFIFSETTINQIRALPEESQLKYFWAVTNYSLEGIESNFTGIELAVWIPMRDLIDTICFNHAQKKKSGKNGGETKARNKKIQDPKQSLAEPSRPLAESSKAKESLAEPSRPLAESSKAKQSLAKDKYKYKDNINLKDKNNIKINSPPFFKNPGLNDLGSRIERAIKTWNEAGMLPKCRKTALNIINSKLESVAVTFQHYSDDEIATAVRNYREITKNPQDFDCFLNYQSFEGFIANGVEKFVDEARPLDRFRKNRSEGDDDAYLMRLAAKAEGG